MPAALVIFDCDGVLVDSEPLACACFSEVLAEHGIDLPPDAVDRMFRGQRMSDCLETLEARFGARLPATFERSVEAKTVARIEKELRPVKGVGPVLDHVRDALRLPCCVASSSDPERIRRSLERTGLARYFGDRVFSATEVARGKPAPDVFLHAARSMAVAPSACAVIEDSDAGIAGARAAGMRVFAFGAAPGRAPDAGRYDFDRMDALPPLLDAWVGSGPSRR